MGETHAFSEDSFSCASALASGFVVVVGGDVGVSAHVAGEVFSAGGLLCGHEDGLDQFYAGFLFLGADLGHDDVALHPVEVQAWFKVSIEHA